MVLALWQLVMIEFGLGAVAILAAHWTSWQRWIARAEGWFSSLAERPLLCFISIAVASLMLRLLLLPIQPVPSPLFHDEFSYLLGADTLLHGRLTNPIPPVPIAFETIHTNISPTYESMYMPGTALALAAGMLVGLPWIAVAVTTALLCATIYWMTSAWLPRSFALAAAAISIAVTGWMNWWFDNYFCLAFTALGTVLVLGSIPRIAKTKVKRWSALLGLGLAFLILTRPYEGFCVAFPCVVVLLWHLRHASWKSLLALSTISCGVLGVAFLWLLYYNWRGTGHAMLFPYMVNFKQYHITGPFLFSEKHALPSYHLDSMRRFYIFAEIPQYDFMRLHPWLFLAKKISVYYIAALFGFGGLVLVGAIYLIGKDRQELRLAPILGLCGFVVNVVLMAWSPFPQYVAPAFPLLVLLVGFGLFHLRQYGLPKLGGVQITRGFVLAELMLLLSLFGYRISESLDFPEPQYVSKDRNLVEKTVLSHPGKQLCLVRYTPFHESWQEWVFNGADLRSERLVWARSLDEATDRAVISAFPGRQVWLVKPDFANDLLEPYSADAPFP